MSSASSWINSSCIAGHEAVEVVYLINNEDQPFRFAFDEASLHCPGFCNSLTVEPMTGFVQPKSKWVYRQICLCMYCMQFYSIKLKRLLIFHIINTFLCQCAIQVLALYTTVNDTNLLEVILVITDCEWFGRYQYWVNLYS